jgi:hypothetical protein
MGYVTYLYICLPLLNIWFQDPTIVGHHPIEFIIHNSSFRPHYASAGIKSNLEKPLTQQEMAAEALRIKCLVQFVGLIDRVDNRLNLPKVLG